MARILVVENNANLGRLIGRYLTTLHHDVSRVSTPSDAEELSSGHFDLLVFYTALPIAVWSDVLAWWRENSPHTKILAISETLTIRERLGKLCPDAQLQTPFRFDSLAEVIDDCLNPWEARPKLYRSHRTIALAFTSAPAFSQA